MNVCKQFGCTSFVIGLVQILFTIVALPSYAQQACTSATCAAPVVPVTSAPLAPAGSATTPAHGNDSADADSSTTTSKVTTTYGPNGKDSTTTTSTTTTGGGAKKDAPTATESCDSKKSLAASICMTNSMDGADSGQAAMMQMMLSQAANQASTISSTGASQSQQCATQGKIAELMAGVNAIKAAACYAAEQLCISTCNDDAEKQGGITPQTEKLKLEVKADKTNATKCKTLTVTAALAAMQAVTYGGQMLSDDACAAATAATPVLAADLSGLTAAVDCSDPATATSNVTCICAANPTNTICGSAVAGSTLGSGGTALGASGPGSVPRPTDQSLATNGIVPSGLGTPAPQSGVTAGTSGGGGGSGLGAGAGGGAGAGAGDDGGGAPVDKQSVITGQSGGGGGGGTGSAGNPNGSNADKKEGGFFDKFNLSKFLPGKKDFQSRGLAGMTGQAKDGITGPMGPSIWEKVSNQYQAQKPRMIQDK